MKSGPPIISRSHELHAGDISGAVGEIASYHKRNSLSPLVPVGCVFFGLSLALPFVFCVMVPAIDFYRIFLPLVKSGALVSSVYT